MSAEGAGSKLAQNQQRVQHKTFTRWVNTHLWDRKLKVRDLSTGLNSGVNLINLMEIISAKSISRWNKNPKMHIHRLENLNKALTFIRYEGLTLVNIGAADIETGNLKIILGMIWTLILRYQIQSGASGGSAKGDLMQWVNGQLQPFQLSTSNLSSSYQNPQILSALVNSLCADAVDLSTVSEPTAVDNVAHAMKTAEDLWGIPQVMDAIDMVEQPDELSIMTYVSYFRDEYNARQRAKLVCGEKSYAEGEGLAGTGADLNRPPGCKLSFTVYAVNTEGQASTTDVECDALLTTNDDSSTIPVKVHNNNDGSFSCAYASQLARGEYRLDIALNGIVVRDSPFAFQVTPTADADKSFASGPGLLPGVDNDTEPREFLVFAIGDDGPVRGAPVEVTVTGPGGEVVPCSCVPVLAGEGTDEVRYTPSGAGVFTIDVRVGGQRIRDMPVMVQLSAGACGAKMTTCQFRVTCTARGDDGHAMEEGGDCVEVHVEAEDNREEVEVHVTDNGDGTYSADYVLQAGRSYQTRCLINGQHTPQSPFRHDLTSTAGTA